MNSRELLDFVNKELGAKFGDVNATPPQSLISKPATITFKGLQPKPRKSTSIPTPAVDPYLQPLPAMPQMPQPAASPMQDPMLAAMLGGANQPLPGVTQQTPPGLEQALGNAPMPTPEEVMPLLNL